MTTIYLVRHAQAGDRENYDVLSDLGREQARALGEHLSREGVELAAVYSGGMVRQRATAEIVCSTLSTSGGATPGVVVDERWNEFSLASVYRAIARRLIADSPRFASDVVEMQAALKRDPHTTRGATGRCDTAVIRAWMENRYAEYEGESWKDFRARIRSCIPDLTAHDSDRAVAVFTSATPIAILTGAALDLSDEKLLSILGVLYNTGTTMIRGRENELRLFTFNQAAHLNNSHRTFR
jgi:broad specificity phosphatase PhoE